MAIRDLQLRQRELGRIRMGEKGAKGQPVKLEHFRLTSPARHLLEHAAALWGGEVREWKDAPSPGQWELYTKTDVLPIVIPPGRDPVSSWYEQWTVAGCTHRCDGGRNFIDETACSCDPDDRACKATTRINLMLPDLPDIGVWRLESHGINAAMELPGTVSVILMASEAGRFLPGRLRIEARTSRKPGQPTRNFVVPVIDLDITSRELMSGEAPKFIESGATPPVALEAGDGHTPAEGVEPAGLVTPPSSPLVTQKDIARIMAVCKEQEISEAELRPMVVAVCGVTSRKLIPADRLDDLLNAIRKSGATKRDEALAEELGGELFASDRQEDL